MAGRLNLVIEKKEAEAGTRARATRFQTLHCPVTTPLFMPVGTQATVKAQDPETLRKAGAQIILGNTYHLLLRPGIEVFKHFGGIHGFAKWDRAVLTDSGGFQVFCMPNHRQMTEEGAIFKSYVDGQTIHLSPEKSIETQKAIGSDIMMVLDQCIPSTSSHAESDAALELTYRWARRSLAARGESPQSMFGIIQGAVFKDLRKKSAEQITSLDLDGFAIGGLAVGETKSEREDMVEWTTQWMPEDRPRYLMGVGTPIDLLEAVHRGVDLFDCVLPTMFAQQGVAFTSRGKIELRRNVHRLSKGPLDPACECSTCQRFDRGYLHHLIRAQEVLGWTLVGTHNLHFYLKLMREIRQSILDETFLPFYRQWKPILESKDLDHPVDPPVRKRPTAESQKILGNYEIVENKSGLHAIRMRSSGEVMHPTSDPSIEARSLYIEQPRLMERFIRNPFGLVVWDVGLGAGTNAMAFIQAVEGEFSTLESKSSRIELISFENDFDSFKLALRFPYSFPYLRHTAPWAIERGQKFISRVAPLEWSCIPGDFQKVFENAPIPRVVFYDPFSFKTDAPLWSVECFESLAKKFRGHPVEMITYSRSTAVRERMLAAGFFVFSGLPTGKKEETTIAMTPEAAALNPGYCQRLGRDWLEHYERSGARTEALSERVRMHPQFDISE